MKTKALVIAVMLVGASTAAAQSSCPDDAAERAAEIRDRLEDERRAASRWRWAWVVGFGAATALQGVMVATETAVGEYNDAAETTLIVGAIKSGIGMTARLVVPIKVPRPAVTGDACADLAAAERAFARAAAGEQRSFWLNHVGGLALQLGGTLYIGLTEDDAWGDAALSFGVGWAVGLASTYTQPRGVWKAHRLTAAPLVAPDGAGATVRGLSLSGTF